MNQKMKCLRKLIRFNRIREAGMVWPVHPEQEYRKAGSEPTSRDGLRTPRSYRKEAQELCKCLQKKQLSSVRINSTSEREAKMLLKRSPLET